MAAQRAWLPLGPATLVALLAAAGLGIWSAERASDALGLGARRAPEQRAPPPRAPSVHPALTFGAEGVQAKGGALPGGADAAPAPAPDAAPAPAPGRDAGPGTDAERLAAAEVTEALGRLVRDLEYNRELPEPPQQTVVRAPPAWHPPPAAEAPPPVIEVIEPRSGPVAGGGRVTLRGRFLRPGQVMFGSAPARIVSTSAGAVTVIAPRGAAGPVAIAVTNDDGAFAVAGQPFTYEPR